jgi:hypothetical protein
MVASICVELRRKKNRVRDDIPSPSPSPSRG